VDPVLYVRTWLGQELVEGHTVVVVVVVVAIVIDGEKLHVPFGANICSRILSKLRRRRGATP
jgi:hypothetical protein